MRKDIEFFGAAEFCHLLAVAFTVCVFALLTLRPFKLPDLDGGRRTGSLRITGRAPWTSGL
jgi:hypothetical protein